MIHLLKNNNNNMCIGQKYDLIAWLQRLRRNRERTSRFLISIRDVLVLFVTSVGELNCRNNIYIFFKWKKERKSMKRRERKREKKGEEDRVDCRKRGKNGLPNSFISKEYRSKYWNCTTYALLVSTLKLNFLV